MYDTSLSVVITAYNEESNVSECLSLMQDFLKKNLRDFEIIFVNDGSTDNTGLEARKFESPQIIIIDQKVNSGTGAGIKEALKVARHEFYCWFPCDLEIMPTELAKPLGALAHNDIVITHFTNGNTVRTHFRHWLSIIFVRILNLSFMNRIKYFNGLSVIRRELLRPQDVKANGFFFHAELLLRTLQATSRYTQVPIKLTPRKRELPKAIRLKVLLDVIVCYFRILWEVKIRNEHSHH
jgi:glycosyltransferase involved in cell wall biosynthesis